MNWFGIAYIIAVVCLLAYGVYTLGYLRGQQDMLDEISAFVTYSQSLLDKAEDGDDE